MNVPGPRHGQICAAICELVRTHARQYQLGHVLSNDAGVITERDPDSVRGADIAFYRYEKIPPGLLSNEYLPVAPDLVFAVLSPGHRRGELLAKIAEYVNAGVTVVCVVDDHAPSVQVFTADRPFTTLTGDNGLVLPDLLGTFRVAVRRFFECS